VYFVTQNPLDVPDAVLAQLGNRVQHALRAFTPRDQKAVRAAAETMRQNPALPDLASVIMELGVGEALCSFLDDKGRPSITERVFVRPPGSQLGPIQADQRQALIAGSLVAGVYEKSVDRLSAYEKLGSRVAASADREAAQAAHTAPGAPGRPAGTAAQRPGLPTAAQPADTGSALLDGLKGAIFGNTGPRGGRYPGLAEKAAASAVRSIGSAVGREIIRGVLGSLLGGSRRR
jgi:DNA helicase HerA-like ATPase